MRTSLLRFLWLLLLSGLCRSVADAQPGTADGTYNFANIGADDDAAPGFKTQEDKFWVSNIFRNNATAMFAGNGTDDATQTGIIRAEFGTVNKRFSLRDMTFHDFNLDNQQLDVFLVILRNHEGTELGRHQLTSPQTIGTSDLKISDIGFSVPWPPNGYDLVTEIELQWHFANNAVAPDELTFVSMDLQNIEAPTTLPLTLIDFRVHAEKDGARLQWTTASEENVSRIFVEQSADGLRFGTIADLPANGRASVYSWLHQNPARGRNYYRLRSVDLDGKQKTYPVRYVDFSSLTRIGIVARGGELLVSGLPSGPVRLQVVDAGGALLWQSAVRIAGPETVAIPAASSGGIRFLVVSGAAATQVLKLPLR